MTDRQWDVLTAIVKGETSDPLVAFIVDSPWLPRWAGHSILDYFASEEVWFSDHLLAAESFPDCIFLPGFWAEYGMCTEPSAFGARCTFPENEFPFSHRIILSEDSMGFIQKPNPKTDGLLPFVIKRLTRAEERMNANGHRIRFAVSRGPLNICSFLMGTTEFLMTLKTEPDAAKSLIATVTEFVSSWLAYQKERFPSIDGIFILDDILGFIGREDFLQFAFKPFMDVFHAFDASVRFLHNDAPCAASAPSLSAMGVNLFNCGIDLPLPEVRKLVGPDIVLMGAIPPRDVLAGGSPNDVVRALDAQVAEYDKTAPLIYSCGGGMPPSVPTENIEAFLSRVWEMKR
ncbi:MAG TPA: uroporphyrinogen decarboxylase family protein [Spirochaetia bacterium]|nr:uroporphyrinogen decarboxylase family protein [Spirochaetia bacterium]